MRHQIQKVYTFQELKYKIASHEYGAELLLQHAMILLENQQWQPIENAPRDGTPILGYPFFGRVCIAQWLFSGWCVDSGSQDGLPFENVPLTMFFPLPPPPKVEP